MKAVIKSAVLVAVSFALLSICANAQNIQTGSLSDPYVPVNVIANGDMSMSTLTSPPINVMSYPHVGIQFIWTGAPVGVLGVQVSDSGKAGTYTPLTLTGLSPAANQPAGTASSWWLDLQTNPQYIEVTYAKTSGTGNLNVYVGGKK